MKDLLLIAREALQHALRVSPRRDAVGRSLRGGASVRRVAQRTDRRHTSLPTTLSRSLFSRSPRLGDAFWRRRAFGAILPRSSRIEEDVAQRADFGSSRADRGSTLASPCLRALSALSTMPLPLTELEAVV